MLEPGAGMNCRMITGVVISSGDMHTLTSESQEVILGKSDAAGTLAPDIEEALQIPIGPTSIPNCGQLNITNSTLPTLT